MIEQKVFPAELDFLYDMLDFIKNYGQLHHLSSSVLDSIILATEEALVNIISYGYPAGKKGTLEIICETTSPNLGIKIVIKDQGVPFNPIENIPSTLPSSNVMDKIDNSLGGYGIYILIELMDRVEYQRTQDGNVLTLIKYADP